MDYIAKKRGSEWPKQRASEWQIQTRPQNSQSKEPQNGQEEEQAETLKDIGLPRTLLSSKRHSSTAPEDVSERWGISLAQATLTLKATTQKLVRSAVMPLARRHRADHMFDVRRVHGMMPTDIMDARCNSIHAEKYLRVFGNREFFVEA